MIDENIIEALRSATPPLLETTGTCEDILEAVRRISAHLAGGESRPSPTGQSSGSCSRYQIPPLALSPREREILSLIAGDGSDREIALKLYFQLSGRCGSGDRADEHGSTPGHTAVDY